MRRYYRLVCWACLLLGIENPAAQGAGFRELPVPGGTLAGPQIGSQRNPAAATNGSVVLVVWDDVSMDGTKRIQAQRFSPEGEPLDPVAVDISTVQDFPEKPRHPAVAALPGGGFLVAWESKAAGVTIAALPATGAPTLQRVRLGVGRDVEIASDGSRFLVTWQINSLIAQSTLGAAVEISNSGVPVAGKPATLASGGEPVVAGGPGRFFLATLTSGGSEWRILDAAVWPPSVETSGTMVATNHAAAADDSGILYAFTDPSVARQVNMRRISWEGVMAGVTMLPPQGTAGYVDDLAAALRPDGSALVAAQVVQDYPSPNGYEALWLWALPPSAPAAPPLLLNGISHSQQDPELLGTAARFWVLWEDRRIDLGSTDQEDIYARLYSGNPADAPEPEWLLTESREAATLEPAGLIADGNTFRVLYSQPLQAQPLPGFTLRRVWEAESGGAARVIGLASGKPLLLPQTAGSLALWDYIPYQTDGSDGPSTHFGMQAVRRDTMGMVTHFEELPGWTTAGGVFGGSGSRSGILTSYGDALGNNYIQAGRVPSGAGSTNGTYQVQIEEYPSPKQPLGFLFAGERSLALWREGPPPPALNPRLRFRRFKDAVDGSWTSVDFIPRTLAVYGGEITDALGVESAPPAGGAWYFARKTASVAGVDVLPANDYSYVPGPDQIFSYTAPAGGTIKDVKLLPLPPGAVVLVLETKAGGGRRLMAQRLYAPLFSYGSFETALIWETDENVEIVAAAANELREIQVLLRTEDPLHPVRLISLQVAPPVIGSVLLENGRLFRAETTGETGWRYLMEESRDLVSWRLSGSFTPGGEQGTWIQGLVYPSNFFRAR